MSLINVTSVDVLNNPAPLKSPLSFEITFDCFAPGVKDDLEWKLLYINDAYNQSNDQLLDTICVGPICIGKNKFLFEAPAPDFESVKSDDLMELTVLLLCGNYKGAEFIRIGYFVTCFYPPDSAPELALEWETAVKAEQDRIARKMDAATNEQPFDEPKITMPKLHYDKLFRSIAANEPRVTRMSIPWDQEATDLLMEQPIDANDQSINQTNDQPIKQPADDEDDDGEDDEEDEDDEENVAEEEDIEESADDDDEEEEGEEQTNQDDEPAQKRRKTESESASTTEAVSSTVAAAQ